MLLLFYICEMDEIIFKIIKEFKDHKNEIYESSLRTYANPPIKGKITKGKIQWRGIKEVVQTLDFVTYYWLDQRGVQISPRITIDTSLTHHIPPLIRVA